VAGRPKIFSEEDVLEKAGNFFWEKGYEASSTDELIKAMGIQRGSFYNTFSSKKELYIRTINFHEKKSLEGFESLLKKSNNPLATIKEVFLSLCDCPLAEHQKGCFAGNTIAELSGIDQELAENAKKHLKEMQKIFFKALVRARNEGILILETDPNVLALYLLNLWNGLNITRRIYPDKTILKPLVKFQLEFLI